MSPTGGEPPESRAESSEPEQPEPPSESAPEVPELPKVLERRKRVPKVAIVAGLVVLAVGVVTAVGLAMRDEESGPTTATSPTTSSQPPTKGQIDYSCRVMTNSSTDAINAVNVYVDTFNANGPQQTQQEQASAAVVALDASIRRIEGTFGPVLPRPLRDALKGYTNAAREVSGAIGRHASEEEFNAVIDRLNATKNSALDQCDALS
jgi:hypothetical protein